MNRLEVFFDYACPFCQRGHGYLEELAPQFPEVEVVWRHCEAHPRPDSYGLHSDLCIQGMFYVLEHGADLAAYHRRMYKAALTERINIESIDTLAEYVGDLVDAADFRRTLREGTYKQVQLDANEYAFTSSGVWAVPSYRMNGKKLDSIENVGVTKKQLEAFLQQG